MKYILCLLSFALLSACCKTKDAFYIQHTDVTAAELPSDCAKDFIHKINTMWLKHGQKSCRYYNTFVFSFSLENKDCLLGMDISLVQRLLGKPDKRAEGKLIYVFDDTCDEYMDTQPNIAFRRDLVLSYSIKEKTVQDVVFVTQQFPQH